MKTRQAAASGMLRAFEAPKSFAQTWRFPGPLRHDPSNLSSGPMSEPFLRLALLLRRVQASHRVVWDG